MINPKRLSIDFFTGSDVVAISRELLGKFLITQIDGQRCGGMIVETEAYAGITDRASHAYKGRKTSRTGVMYRRGGLAYIYLVYGIHHLFNVVTNTEGIPDAVLIRAIEPTDNLPLMNQRYPHHRLTAGPGRLTRALGITTALNGESLIDGRIWLEDRGMMINPQDITSGPRIGVAYAGEDAARSWRFCIRDHPWVSDAK